MKPLIVYQSRTGNTRVIADPIAAVLNADVLSVETVSGDDFKGRTLVGFGSGIYWTRMDSRIYAASSCLDPGCNAFVFITSGFGFPFMLYLYWYFIRKGFDRLGIRPVGQWGCRGHDKYPLFKWMGISREHPNRTDIENARKFAIEMQQYE